MMPDLKIHLDGDGCWPDLNENRDRVIEGRKIEIAYLSHGMASGKPSVTIRVDLPDGRVVLAQTSLALFEAATRAFQGRREYEAGQN